LSIVSNQKSCKISKKTYGLIFCFFFLIYISSSGGHTDGYDGIVYFLITENIVNNQSIMIDPQSPSLEETKFDLRNYLRAHGEISAAGIQDDEPIPKAYVNYAVLLSALAVPFYVLSILLSQNPLNFVPLFTNATVLALTAITIFSFSFYLYKSFWKSFVLALLFGVTSFVWAYTSTMFTQPILGLCAIAAVYFLYISKNNSKHYEIFGGLILGATILAHPFGITMFPAILVYGIVLLRKERKKLGIFVLASFLVLSFALFLNEERFGSFTDFGYRSEQTLQNHSQFVGGIAMLFSPGKGLLFLFPISVLVPLGIWKLFKLDKKLVFLIGYIFLTTWLWFGSVNDPTWGANGNWGPRYLIPTLPFLILPIGILLDLKSMRPIIIGLAIWGFFVNLLGKLVWDMYGYSYGWERLEMWKLGDVSWSVFTWDISRTNFVMHWNVLNSDYLL